jgi:hypothetical protein
LSIKKFFLAILASSSFSMLFVDAKAAKANLSFNIYEDLGNLIVETSGSLNLTTPIGGADCGSDGAILPSYGFICTGPNQVQSLYQISGPSVFTGSGLLYPATSVSGILTGVAAGLQRFVIDSAYVSGTPIVSGATYVGKSLSDLGLNSASGTLGTWTLVGTSETISINVTSPTPPAPSVPGPLPLFGAGSAFGFSRHLRNRLKSRQTPA